jgi:hypothetical protein
MSTNPTENALLARGMDSVLAKHLREAGWTLRRLQAADDDELQSLGVDAAVRMALRQGGRPAIPAANLAKVLFANRWLCCVCRDPAMPIIVHHIEPWATSHDHSPDNLAVLCTRHHGEAHITRDLELTLSPTRLRSLKHCWEQEVCRKDRVAIQQGSQLQAENWLYFNHLRLFDFAQGLGIDLTELSTFEGALASGVCDAAGAVVKAAEPGRYRYADSDGMPLYRFMKDVLHAVLAVATVRNVSDDLDRSVLTQVIVPGDIVFVQGLHSFTDVEPTPSGVQLVRGARSANRVEISFVFDRSEATSSSAWSNWLRRRQGVGSLIQVKQLERAGDKLQIEGTVLAIRTALEGLKERMYELSLYEAGLGLHDDREEDDFSQFEESDVDS